MRKFFITCVVLAPCLDAGRPCVAGPDCASDNGDVNADRGVDLSDAVYSLAFLFQGGPSPVPLCVAEGIGERCANQNGDVNGDGKIDISDAVYILAFLFLGGPAPVPVCQDGAPPVEGFTFDEMNAQGYPEYTHKQSGNRFVRLPGGSFDMGSPETETGRSVDEGPVHRVSLSPFLIGKYEVTQAEYEAVMTGHATLSETPSAATGADLPVERVSWIDLHLADGFLQRTGLVLPSEAQWEYACRAGRAGPYSGTGNLDDMGWYVANSGGATHAVGTKQANQFGLHDTHGNIFEWCEDVFDRAFYGRPEARGPNPVATAGRLPVVRGGSFDDPASLCRSAYRGFTSPVFRDATTGFRLAAPSR